MNDLSPTLSRSLLAISLAFLYLLGGAGCSPAGYGNKPATSRPSQLGVFRDVAGEAGLTFQWGHGGRSPLNIIETLGHGSAFLDYNQDGNIDAFLVGNRKCGLFRGDGKGRFTEVTAEAGLTAEGDFYGVAVGDYDNDGYPDAYVTGYGKCVLYHNKRGKGFEDVTGTAGVGARSPYDVVTAAGFVDLDGDGKLDLFAGRYIVFTPKEIRFCTYGTVRAGCGVKNYNPDFPRVYRNLGGGKFTDMTKPWGFGVLAGRCLGVAVCAAESGRGVMLYAANDELPGNLMSLASGRYTDIGVSSGTAHSRDGLPQGGMGVDWGDFNNDGRADLIVTTFETEPKSLYRNDGNLLFTELSGTYGISAATTANVGWAVKFVDYDNDGWLDLFLTNGHSQDNAEQVEKGRSYPQLMQLFHNEAGKVFRDAAKEGGPLFSQPIVGRGAAFGDYDNDGKVDALVVNEEGPALLLHNEAKTSGHWLGVRLVGVKCNRDAIGARVTIKAGGKTFMRDLSLCGSYLSSHDPRLHFGLGDAQNVDKLVVRWPNGREDTLKDLPADKYMTITEGGKVVP